MRGAASTGPRRQHERMYRGLLDAFSGILYLGDSQIAELHISKAIDRLIRAARCSSPKRETMARPTGRLLLSKVLKRLVAGEGLEPPTRGL
jgi:hypothetical protein